MRRISMVLFAVLLIMLVAAPALAHVTVQPNEAEAGSFSRFVVRVPNERDEASTTRVEVQLPENLTSVSFQPKEGWERTVEMTTLDEPIEVFGQEVTEAIGTVTWEGGEIAPGEFEEFGFSARTPDDPQDLTFPAVQTYSSGEEVHWIGPEDSDEPAAVVTTVDLAAGEDQGPLGVLASLSQGDAEEAGPGAGLVTLALILGAAGFVAGVAGLLVALRRRPADRSTPTPEPEHTSV